MSHQQRLQVRSVISRHSLQNIESTVGLYIISFVYLFINARVNLWKQDCTH